MPSPVQGRYALGQGVAAGGTDVFVIGIPGGGDPTVYTFTLNAKDQFLPQFDGTLTVQDESSGEMVGACTMDSLLSAPGYAHLAANYEGQNGLVRLNATFFYEDLDIGPSRITLALTGPPGVPPQTLNSTIEWRKP